MGKKLLEKAGLVLAPRPNASQSNSATGNESTRPKTAIGAMAQFTDRQSAAIKEAAALRTQLKEYEGSLPSRKIDPSLIQRSRWANRHDLSFTGPDFESLKGDIAEAGGNVQPIKVRPLNDSEGRYEIVFGHRRHQACLELGLPVLVIVEPLDDKHLFIEMDRENRQRKDLRPYEVGAMYNHALKEGLFSSARKLAEEVGIDQSQLSKALALARLPSDVLNAFVSPLDLQYRWVAELTNAIQKDPEKVLSLAKAIVDESPRPSSTEVYRRFVTVCEAEPRSTKKTEAIKGKAGEKATMVFDRESRSVRVDLKNIDPSRFADIREAIRKLL